MSWKIIPDSKVKAHCGNHKVFTVMQIFSYKKAQSLHCRFAKHLFELEKDHGKNWYMVVRNDAGEYACDGYIPESQNYTAKQAMIEACKGAMIEPPKKWNIE